MADEEIQLAQATPPKPPTERITSDQLRERLQPKTTPGGTPIGSPSEPWLDINPGRDLEPEKQKSKDDRAAAAQKRKDTMTMDQFEAPNLAPKNQQDLDGWYESLSGTNLEKAKKLQDYLKSKGYKGWFDPAIKGADLRLRDYLFHETAPHWHESTKPKARSAPSGPPDPSDPAKFFGKEKRSELKDDAPALAEIGGNYMGEDA